MNDIKDLLKEIKSKTVESNMTSEEFKQFLVDEYNESEGDLNKSDGINCELCKNKGWIQYYKDGYTTMKPCYCTAKRKVFQRAKSSGLGEYLNKHLADYIVLEEWQAKNKLMVKDFIDNHSQDNTWIMACGTSGSGKTLLCSIIANELLFNAGREVLYITWTDFISRVKRDVMGDKTNAVSQNLDDVKKAEVLFLDEVIKKYNETDLKYLIEIVNYRYTNNKKTIITSERVIDELLDIDEATFGRAVEKCGKYLINIPKDRTKNYRLRALNR